MLFVNSIYRSLSDILFENWLPRLYNEGAFSNGEAVKDNGKYLKAIIDKLNSDGTLAFMKSAKDSKELPEDIEVHTNDKFNYVKDLSDTDWTITPGGVTSQRPFNDRLSMKASKK